MLKEASDCNMLCAGDRTEYCGGSSRLNLYLNSSASVVPSVNPGIANYTYQGCYTDSVVERVLMDASQSGSDMTVAKCASICAPYTYFGTEYSAECFCGNALRNTTALVDESECGMTCAGNSTQLCGGGNRLSVYSKSI